MADRILRRPEVELLTGLSRSTLYAMIAEGSFPEPLRLGRRAVGWRESVVEEWIGGRAPAGRSSIVAR
ncbi:AlpA family phage regulatory protein [Halovulum dunhuangense]|uniref:AlpA family phage regulatory protein n=1 Tax=Halovulum dunhuangense TaxID=1505036 RepID=A0A849L2A7_9RHOB|nr:AlpA family transcriptional regulator [Halovulum dunhuangense]NNU80409.1 AlpA family phage regulatory protein [Halovulum dunhuangense]